MNRREFLTTLTGAAATLASLPVEATTRAVGIPFFTAHCLPIGIQLFPLSALLRADLDRTFARLAAIGYREVEMAGFLRHSAEDFRAALDRHGLRCRCMHVAAQPWFGPGTNLDTDFDTVVADAQAIGATDIVMPLFLFRDYYDAARWPTTHAFLQDSGRALVHEDFLRTAAFLNDKGAALKARGLHLGYHNHNAECAPLAGGFTGMELMLDRTDPTLVSFELDVGWAVAAGVDVPMMLTTHAGRFTKLHVKDIASGQPVNFAFKQVPRLLGQGVVDWRHILPIAYCSGTRTFYVEQEAPFDGDPVAAMAANFRYLATLKTA